MLRNIALLGSTGSIGRNALELIELNKDRFKLIGIAAGENINLAVQQAKRFSPRIITVKRKNDAETLKREFPGIKVYWGPEGLMDLVSHPTVDTMISAIDGTAALEATIAAIQRNQRICFANKETLVAAGELINQTLAQCSAELIPIDSEQSAIFQCLGINKKQHVKKIILTASGGPFHRRNKKDFPLITFDEAIKHPTWSMGTKISIDSATLMNKALEIIEAFFLFQLKKEQIDTIIHPQSIVHSMVEFIDSSIIAQLSVPDMKIPILYSLSYPERIPFENNRLNFLSNPLLEFFPVDMEKFGSIRMAYHVLENGKNSGAVLNAANEVAVDYFIKGKISFSDIFSVVETVFYNETFYPVHSIDDINQTIKETKDKTGTYIRENIPLKQ